MGHNGWACARGRTQASAPAAAPAQFGDERGKAASKRACSGAGARPGALVGWVFVTEFIRVKRAGGAYAAVHGRLQASRAGWFPPLANSNGHTTLAVRDSAVAAQIDPQATTPVIVGGRDEGRSDGIGGFADGSPLYSYTFAG